MDEYALNPNIGFVPLIDKVPWVIGCNPGNPKEDIGSINDNTKDNQELKKWAEVGNGGSQYNDDDYTAAIDKMLSLRNDLQEIFEEYKDEIQYEMQRDHLSEWLDEDDKALYLLND